LVGNAGGMGLRSVVRSDGIRLRGLFEDGGHGALGGEDAGICAVGVDLGLVGFTLGTSGGFEDDSALGVDDAGEGPGFFEAVTEDGAEHFDDVLVGMLVVVEQDEVVQGGDFGLFDGGVSGARCDDGRLGDHWCYFAREHRRSSTGLAVV
jgi:hypothetical protein